MVTSGDDSTLPGGLAAPARRALAAAGVRRLDLARFREEEILSLHGMGPKAINQLRSALRERGLEFAASQQP